MAEKERSKIQGDVDITPEARSGIESGITSQLLETTITNVSGDKYFAIFGGTISKPFIELEKNDDTIDSIQKRINHLLNLPPDIHKEDSDYNIQNLRNRLELLELSRGKPYYPNNGNTYYYNNFNSTILNGPKAHQYAAAFINTVRESGKGEAASSRNVPITIKFKGETTTVKNNQVSIVKGAFLDGGRPPNLVQIAQQGSEIPLLSVKKEGEGKDVKYIITDPSTEITQKNLNFATNVRPMYFASVMSLQLQSKLSCTPSQAQSIVRNYASLFSKNQPFVSTIRSNMRLSAVEQYYDEKEEGKRELNEAGKAEFKKSLKETLFCDDNKANEILMEFEAGGSVAHLVDQLQSQNETNKRHNPLLGHLGNTFKNDNSIQKTPTTYVVRKDKAGNIERILRENYKPPPPTLAIREGENDADKRLREIKQNKIAENVGKLDYVTIQKYQLLVDFYPESLKNLTTEEVANLKSTIDTKYKAMCQDFPETGPSKSSGQGDDLTLATSPSDAAKPSSPKSGPGATLEGTSPQKNEFDKMVAEINKTNNLLTPIEDTTAYIKRIEETSKAATGNTLTLGPGENGPGK